MLFLCDVSKTFDRVWHRGLILKLHAVGISSSQLDWFENYLYDRKQRGCLNGVYSNSVTIEAGVPQGSILGPLLFLIYINDIVSDITSNVKLFADDTSLSMVVENPIITADILNDDLQKINSWANKWLVTFNPDKTESMLISKKITSLIILLYLCKINK